MWKFAFLGLAVGASAARPRERRDTNSSQSQSPLNASSQSSSSMSWSTVAPTLTASTSGPPRFSLDPSLASYSVSSLSFTASRSINDTNSSTTFTGPCTGCVLQAYAPVTTFFDEEDEFNQWTSVVVTETILTEIVTFMDGTTVDEVVTMLQTVNQTKTVTDEWDQIITATAPQFVIQPTPGVSLTVDAGPTYVIYNNIAGALDNYIDSTYSILRQTLRTCVPTISRLDGWEPTATEDWSYFIETFTEAPQERTSYLPVPLPSQLIEFLKQDPDIVSQFRGSDIATCTQRRPNEIGQTPGPPGETEVQTYPTTLLDNGESSTEAMTTAPMSEITRGTFISTTYESTSTHITRQGCLRCQNTQQNDAPAPAPTDGPISNNINDNTLTPTQRPDNPNNPENNPENTPENNPENNPNNDPNKPENDPNDPPSIPDMIISIIHNNPSIFPQPPNPSGQSITIGDSVLPINTPRPTQNNPDQPNEPSQPTPIIVIGTETFFPGETKTINGIPVVAPTNGGGSRLVVDGTTITVNPGAPTGAPVLTVGSDTVTANTQGQFVIGTQTLNPGGSAITVDGTTYSLEPSGTAVVVNGVTSTLANSGPVTAAPALIIEGKSYSATVRDGTTEYVLGQGTTLKPGEAVTISGTTYSLVPEGTALVVNGQTSSVSSKVPASNSASTTHASSAVRTSSSSRTASTSSRDAGEIIASVIGESSRGAGALAHGAGVDKIIEGVVIGAAGWLLMLF